MARLNEPPTQEVIDFYKPTHIIYQRKGGCYIKQRPARLTPKK